MIYVAKETLGSIKAGNWVEIKDEFSLYYVIFQQGEKKHRVVVGRNNFEMYYEPLKFQLGDIIFVNTIQELREVTGLEEGWMSYEGGGCSMRSATWDNSRVIQR